MTMQSGDLIDLAGECPARCVVWDRDGTAWATQRTDVPARCVDRPAVHEVVGRVDDGYRFLYEPEQFKLALTRRTFGDSVRVVAFDSAVLRSAAARLIEHYRETEPDVFGDAAWWGLVEAVEGDASDGRLVDAVIAVVSWCRAASPGRLERAGWRALIHQTEDYRPW